MGARWYAPKVGRWVSADPLFLQSPEKGLESTLELNLYSYAVNNPVSLSDPTGYSPQQGMDLPDPPKWLNDKKAIEKGRNELEKSLRSWTEYGREMAKAKEWQANKYPSGVRSRGHRWAEEMEERIQTMLEDYDRVIGETIGADWEKFANLMVRSSNTRSDADSVFEKKEDPAKLYLYLWRQVADVSESERVHARIAYQRKTPVVKHLWPKDKWDKMQKGK